MNTTELYSELGSANNLLDCSFEIVVRTKCGYEFPVKRVLVEIPSDGLGRFVLEEGTNEEQECE